MTCYVTYDGTIKLDGYAVGRVCPIPLDATCSVSRWVWTALVNGRRLGKGDCWWDRMEAFDCARLACDGEAAVIR